MPVTRDTSQRRLQISELVRQHGSVQVTSLAKRFGVSMQTVRKDLRFLTERGVMARAYGGGIDSKVVGGPTAEAPYETKRTSHLEEKRRIGQEAAALVQPGDTIDLIASDELGAPTDWRRLAEANNLNDPRRLRPGQALLIPAEV